MSRLTDRAPRIRQRLTFRSVLLCAIVALFVVPGCKELDGRNRNRTANRDFREKHFIDASAGYEKALKTVNDPIIHYNLGLTYSKLVRAGSDKPVLLGVKGEFVCNEIPGVKEVEARVCVKPGDRHYEECDGDVTTEASVPKKKKPAPVAEAGSAEGSGSAGSAVAAGSGSPGSGSAVAAGSGSAGSAAGSDSAAGSGSAVAAAPVQPQEEEDLRKICPSSFRCVKNTMCSLPSPVIADYAAQHFLKWMEANPNDEDARKLATAAWLDTNQYDKALDYWGKRLAAKPTDTAVMGVLAGINLKANDWRKSIEWYNKVAELSSDPTSKVASFQFIGNVAWAKLNSKTLPPLEAIELADRGLSALQRAAVIQPTTPSLFGLQASIYNFRALNQGSSIAGAIDRATAQDLQSHTRVLSEKAKLLKGQGSGASTPTTPSSPSMSGGPAGTAGG
ncbi:MAG: hypothetical protein WKG01_09770 [Kofleriaceae bacterium]